MRRQTVIDSPLDFDAALIRGVQTGQKLDQRGFAGAILSDKSVDGAALGGKRRSGERLGAAEAFNDAVETQDRHAARFGRLLGYGHEKALRIGGDAARPASPVCRSTDTECLDHIGDVVFVRQQGRDVGFTRQRLPRKQPGDIADGGTADFRGLLGGIRTCR